MTTMLLDYFKKAKEGGFALGAFNIDALETLKGVGEAVKNWQLPAIVEVSPGEGKYLGLQNFVALTANLKEELGVNLFLNLDHADDLEVIKNAVELGFDMVHFDGSKLPLEENIKLAREAVEMAHEKGALVEGEFNKIPNSNANGQGPMTNDQEAKRFTEETGVDILAVSVGNQHGLGENEKLDLEMLKKIREALPETFFSLHGVSGVGAEDIRAAICLGIVKINISTELRMVFRENLENMLKGNPEELAWYKLAGPAVEAVREVVEGKIKLFGTI